MAGQTRPPLEVTGCYLTTKNADLSSGYHGAGSYSVAWNASNQASGAYFARFNAADANGNVKYSKINRLLLMK